MRGVVMNSTLRRLTDETRRMRAGDSRTPSRAWPRFAAVRFAAVRLAAVLVIIWLAQPTANEAAASPGRPWEVDLELGLGRDDNALRESTGTQGGLYFPYDLGLRYLPFDGMSSRLRLDVGLDGEFHDGPKADADEHEESVALGFDWRLRGGSRRFVHPGSVDLEIEGDVLRRDLTYFSRIAGEEYSVFIDGIPVSLADRFDSMTWSGEARLVVRAPRPLQWTAGYRLRNRNYVEDYADIAGVDPLDYEETRYSSQLRASVTGRTRLSLEYSRTQRDYRRWTARDLDGNLFAGVYQEFDYDVWKIEVEQKTGRGDRFEAGLELEQRNDPFQKYYDHDEWSTRIAADLAMGRGWDLRADWKYTLREYDRARVGYNLFKPLREDLDRHFELEIARSLSVQWEAFAITRHENTDERNPSFTFDRNQTWLGVRFTSTKSVQ